MLFLVVALPGFASEESFSAELAAIKQEEEMAVAKAAGLAATQDLDMEPETFEEDIKSWRSKCAVYC